MVWPLRVAGGVTRTQAAPSDEKMLELMQQRLKELELQKEAQDALDKQAGVAPVPAARCSPHAWQPSSPRRISKQRSRCWRRQKTRRRFCLAS